MSHSVKVFKMSLVFGVAMLMSVPSRAGRAEPKPPKTIVLVHGAFADGSSWDKVFPLLAAKGYNVVAVHEPFTSFADDVAATRRAIELQPGEVILVGHSYGGAVITEAGNSEKVIRLVYVAAFAPDAGESINDLGKGQPAPRWLSALKIDSGGFAWLPPEIIATEFAQDLPPTEVRLLASKQGPILTRNFDAKITNAAWKAKPTSYLETTEDHMIAPRAQAFMAKRMNATVTSVSASHVAMLSKPKDVAAAILQAATAAPVTANK